jgi:hypothetical protein
MTPLVLEAHSHVILISFLLLATAGALVCVDTLAHKLLGHRAQANFSTQVYNKCSCALCRWERQFLFCMLELLIVKYIVLLTLFLA